MTAKTNTERSKAHRARLGSNAEKLGGMTITSPKAVESLRRLKALYGTKGAIEYALANCGK
jgi:hypothetical protein